MDVMKKSQNEESENLEQLEPERQQSLCMKRVNNKFTPADEQIALENQKNAL